MIWALFGGGKGGSTIASRRRPFAAPDGLTWDVEARMPGASNVMVVFHHPDIQSTTRNRYAWHITSGPEARDVKARLVPQQVLESLTDADLARLFRRSMPIASQAPRPAPAVAGGGSTPGNGGAAPGW